MKRVELFVTGLPVAQPRPRATSFGGKARMYNPGTSNEWKACVIHEIKEHAGTFPAGTPVRCYLWFFLPRPRSHFGSGKNAATLKESAPMRPTGKPDLDNLDKAVCDAITAAGVWHDDSQVVSASVHKLYAKKSPGCHIIILEEVQ